MDISIVLLQQWCNNVPLKMCSTNHWGADDPEYNSLIIDLTQEAYLSTTVAKWFARLHHDSPSHITRARFDRGIKFSEAELDTMLFIN